MSGESPGQSPADLPVVSRRTLLSGAAFAAAGALAPSTASATAEQKFEALPDRMVPPRQALEGYASSSLDLKRFSHIDGTPVYYWRGNIGNQYLRRWYCTPLFYERLVRWIRDLRRLSRDAGYPSLDYLVSAGFYVNKPGQHGRGTAMDLDVVQWADRRCSPLAGHHKWGSTRMDMRYLAIDATLRRRLHWVLDGFYNSAHEDHFHADVASKPPVLDNRSRSDTVFWQRSANLFMGAGIAVDGIWGPITQGWFNRIKDRLGLPGPGMQKDPVRYKRLLARVARHGFRGERI